MDQQQQNKFSFLHAVMIFIFLLIVLGLAYIWEGSDNRMSLAVHSPDRVWARFVVTVLCVSEFFLAYLVKKRQKQS